MVEGKEVAIGAALDATVAAAVLGAEVVVVDVDVVVTGAVGEAADDEDTVGGGGGVTGAAAFVVAAESTIHLRQSSIEVNEFLLSAEGHFPSSNLLQTFRPISNQ